MASTLRLRRHLSSSSEDISGAAASGANTAGALSWKGNQRQGLARSVYGGAGGYNTRISVARYMGAGNAMGGELFSGNEKLAMQNLNDRLASYLEKVRTLEQSNASLELKVKQWYEANAPTSARDYSAYYKQIEELRREIKDAELERAQWLLKIDNTRMAIDDFRLKYESEKAMRLAVEADLQGLSKVFDDLTLLKADLETQIEEITKDLALLKKEHQEEVKALSSQLGKSVTVEMDAAPGINLGAIMNEMRQKYEVMAQENLQKAKEQFELQISALQQEVTVSTEELKGAEIQVKELRQNYQSYEIELRSILSLKDSLENTLEDTKLRYEEQCDDIQRQLNSLKDQLMQIKNDSELHMKEYDMLLDIKTRLEQEIATYRRLLEGEEVSITKEIVTEILPVEEKELKKTRKIKTVVEEMVDGKVVSSKIKEVEEDM